jgi:glycosyltransferase involved in cell wall biosynthesis
VIIKSSFLGLWGQLGNGNLIADGQAVRSNTILKHLYERYGKKNITILSTNKWKNNPFLFLIDTLILYIQSRNLLILPADNGFKVIVKLYSFFNLFFKKDIYYIVIGGFLPELLQKNPSYIKKLRKFKYIYVQTKGLMRDLNNLGLLNVRILSNFKDLETVELSSLHINKNKTVKFCTLSRVTIDKGIIDAIESIKIASDIIGKDRIFLDIYGIVDEKFKSAFFKLIQDNANLISYKGIINYNETVKYLKDYFCLLFPTYFHGEGFPGCIIDAFHTGLPIIATKWNYNSEIISNGINGFLVDIRNPNNIAKFIIELYNDRNLAYQISKNNQVESLKYSPSEVLKQLFDDLDKNKL